MNTTTTDADQLIYMGSMYEFHGWLVTNQCDCPCGLFTCHRRLELQISNGVRNKTLVHARKASIQPAP